MHWTYAPVAGDDVCQGDILRRTERLDALLSEHHPGYEDAKYVAFAVTTQSCDLVLREQGRCAVRYVSLAPVRTLESFLPAELRVHGVADGNVFLASRRAKVMQFLERLLNQNEQAAGLFYLHPDPDSSIPNAWVALLRLSISLKSAHYGALAAARIARLTPEFRGKFGWLVGNLFSRVATTDWYEQGAPDFPGMLAKVIANLVPRPEWLDDKAWNKARKKVRDLQEKDRQALLDTVAQFTADPPGEAATKRIGQLLEKHLERAEAAKLFNIIRSDSLLSSYLKRLPP